MDLQVFQIPLQTLQVWIRYVCLVPFPASIAFDTKECIPFKAVKMWKDFEIILEDPDFYKQNLSKRIDWVLNLGDSTMVIMVTGFLCDSIG